MKLKINTDINSSMYVSLPENYSKALKQVKGAYQLRLVMGIDKQWSIGEERQSYKNGKFSHIYHTNGGDRFKSRHSLLKRLEGIAYLYCEDLSKEPVLIFNKPSPLLRKCKWNYLKVYIK